MRQPPNFRLWVWALSLHIALGCGTALEESAEIVPERTRAPMDSAAAPEPPETPEPRPGSSPDPCFGVVPARQTEHGGGGGSVDLQGQVLDPLGGGIANATVTLVNVAVPIGQPRPRVTRALVRARTDERGCFGLVGTRLRRWDELFLLIEADGFRRTSDLRLLHDHSLMVRFAPTRTAPIVLECDRPCGLASVKGYWGRGQSDRVLWRSHTPEDPLRPGFDLLCVDAAACETWYAQNERHVRRRNAEVQLPIGANTLIIQGEAGLALLELHVPPGAGPLEPIHVRVPHPQHGSISIGLREPTPPDSFHDESRLHLSRGEHFDQRYLLPRDGTLNHIERLPPGEYHLGQRDDPHCRHTIVLGPGEHRTLVVDDYDCAVSHWRRPDTF